MRRLIRVDGSEVDLPEPLSLRQYMAMIDADTLDTVTLHHMGQPLHVMLVDDVGYVSTAITDGNALLLVPLSAKKPINEKATALYHRECVPGTTHRIAGDVVIVPDDDFAP